MPGTTLAARPPRPIRTAGRGPGLARTHVASGSPGRFVLTLASAALVFAEATGTLLLWGPVPLAWAWFGGRVYALTGSLAADGAVGFAGFVATVGLALQALNRVDGVWVTLRCRAGHDQREGALTRVVIVTTALGIALFMLWYFVLERAFILPFMPSNA